MSKQYVGFFYEDYKNYSFPARQCILSPWLTRNSLNMIYSWRGVGKTHAALGIAYAVASGGDFLDWKADEAQGVLYIDGEMPGDILQERLKSTERNSTKSIANNMFKIYGIEPQGIMPDIATYEGQKEINQWIDDETKLIIIDNLSCLARSGGRENEAESWTKIADWALKQRANGRSIIFIHHSGKDGNQRGTSKREDILDTVIALKRPDDYEPEQGAKFEVHFEKARHLHGDSVKPFTVNLDSSSNQWIVSNLKESNKKKIIAFHNAGLSNVAIANELSISRQAVCNQLRRAKN